MRSMNACRSLAKLRSRNLGSQSAECLLFASDFASYFPKQLTSIRRCSNAERCLRSNVRLPQPRGRNKRIWERFACDRQDKRAILSRCAVITSFHLPSMRQFHAKIHSFARSAAAASEVCRPGSFRGDVCVVVFIIYFSILLHRVRAHAMRDLRQYARPDSHSNNFYCR